MELLEFLDEVADEDSLRLEGVSGRVCLSHSQCSVTERSDNIVLKKQVLKLRRCEPMDVA